MALISEYRKLSSQIEKVQEKIKFKTELLELDIRLIKEKTESKIVKQIMSKETSDLLLSALEDTAKTGTAKSGVPINITFVFLIYITTDIITKNSEMFAIF